MPKYKLGKCQEKLLFVTSWGLFGFGNFVGGPLLGIAMAIVGALIIMALTGPFQVNGSSGYGSPGGRGFGWGDGDGDGDGGGDGGGGGGVWCCAKPELFRASRVN